MPLRPMKVIYSCDFMSALKVSMANVHITILTEIPIFLSYTRKEVPHR